jgi:TnpA family transposase
VALYVIDALCHHESDLHIREHFTDTGGRTEQVSALLGFRFASRISDNLSKKLYLPGEVEETGALGTPGVRPDQHQTYSKAVG